MRDEPKVGLVSVLFNGVEVLEGFFESLSRQTFTNTILYVIDNSPDDIALDEAKRLAERYRIRAEFINNRANLGVAKGNNQGIYKALESECDYVLLLNNDIEFNEDTIRLMVEYAQDKGESIIVPKIYYHGSNKLWMAGGHISKIRGISPHRGDGEEDWGQYDAIEYVEYAPTCFMLIKKEVFQRVGMMDERYFVYYDDTDFVWRANGEGYKIVYYPDATVSHKVSFSTGGGESLFSIFYTTRNRIYFIRKNFTIFFQIISFGFFYATRILKYISYDSGQRQRLMQGLKEGWNV
jgi:GT2 family glycosyltransferase